MGSNLFGTTIGFEVLDEAAEDGFENQKITSSSVREGIQLVSGPLLRLFHLRSARERGFLPIMGNIFKHLSVFTESDTLYLTVS